MPIIDNILRTVLLTVLLAAPCSILAQRDTLHLVDWQFSRSLLTPEAATRGEGVWTTVRLPHDFQISQPWVKPEATEQANRSDASANTKSRLSARGFKEMGTGWYRCILHPADTWRGRHISLEFGGIMLVGDVYLNGERIGGTDYGYVGFGIDVSRKLHYGQDNILVVRASTGATENSRWYTGGGLFRNVELVLTDGKVAFDRHPLHITTRLSGDTARVGIGVQISTFGKEKRGTVAVEILDATGRRVALSRQELIYQRRKQTNEYRLRDIVLPKAHLWDVDDPYLYNVVATVTDTSGNRLDRVEEQMGVRSIEFGPSFGFRLNGRKVLLKGIANHHTLGALGAAAFPRAIEKRIQLLKSFGFNCIRCSHNPYSEDLYRLADRYGMIVVDELYDKWLTQYAGGRKEWTSLWQKDVPEWVQRDRNHPSVVLWSLGNELQHYASLPFGDWGVTPYRLLRTLVMRYDSTRLTTVAMHPRYRNWQTDSLPCDLARATDIQSYNYRYKYFDGDGRRFPWMTFFQSEASMSDMGTNWFGMNLDRVIGAAYWGMIDYLGESRGWPKKGWNSGAFDISLEPKPKAWLLKSMFTDVPTVHIGVVEPTGDREDWNGVDIGTDEMTDHWNRKPGKKYTVYTFTNCDEVELLLNGRSLGRKKNTLEADTRDRIRWDNVPFEAGRLEAVAWKNGEVAARHEIKTAGNPQKLVLEPDLKTWQADGISLLHVRITAVDRHGIRCPMAADKLRITVDGDATIAAVDNGDIASPESYAPDTATQAERSLYMGSAQVILRAGTHGGIVRLTVDDGKRKAQLRIKLASLRTVATAQ